ncbi:MAG: hypothetical protein ACREUU_10515, partial [Gammaproteobacteria bacterium]
WLNCPHKRHWRYLMRTRLIAVLLALVVAGCRSTAPDPTLTAAPAVKPTTTLPAELIPPPTVPLTATSLAEGIIMRLATPDPSPNCPDHYPWFFDNPAEECATTLLNTWGVMQQFEHGIMVWFQEGGRTYILIEDGSLFKPYQEAFDTVGPPLPGPDPNLAPPPGLYQPVLGFARFWRGLAPGYEWVRERLGWAVAPEAGYSAFWQCNNSSGDSARCYFTGPHDEIIAITRGSVHYWNYWQEPVR